MGIDQRTCGYRSVNVWVQIRECVGIDQRMCGYRSENVWVQIRECVGTDQRMCGYRSEWVKIRDWVQIRVLYLLRCCNSNWFVHDL